MPSVARAPRKGESVLWRNASIGCRSGTVLILVLRYRDPEDRAKGFRLLLGRMDTPTGWRRFLEGLEKLEPAATFNVSSLGIPEDLSVYYSTRAWTNSDMRRWMKSKLKRTVPENIFLKKEERRKKKIRLPVEIVKRTPGKWVVAKDTRKWGRPGKDGA